MAGMLVFSLLKEIILPKEARSAPTRLKNIPKRLLLDKSNVERGTQKIAAMPMIPLNVPQSKGKVRGVRNKIKAFMRLKIRTMEKPIAFRPLGRYWLAA